MVTDFSLDGSSSGYGATTLEYIIALSISMMLCCA